MAKYDIPASLKYINKVTQKKIHYIGHSQGTLIMFIALASKFKGVEENLASFNAYGPVTYMKQTSSKAFTSLAKTRIGSLLYVSQQIYRKIM
jgi:lysosomal acid lipase/cholesteryl ester hydrolase